MALGKNSRVVTLLNLLDGQMCDFEDDGVDSVGKPKVRRLALLAALKKKIKAKAGQGSLGAVFRAGKVVVEKGKDGVERTRFVPTTISPMFDGDTLPDEITALDTSAIEIVKKNFEERARAEELRKPRIMGDAIAFMKQFIEQAQRNGIAPPTSSPAKENAGG